MKRYHLILTVIALFAAVTYSASSAEAKDSVIQQQSCGLGNVTINEIDYTQPSTDNREFIELKGIAAYALDGLEVQFFSATSSSAYRTIALDGQSLSSTGYLVIGSSGLSLPSYSTKLDVSATDFIENAPPGGVGIYDTTADEFCAFVNYGGTVAGFENWLNIGQDSTTDGIERGCMRGDSGWWSCDEQTTPGGSNDVVAVQLSDTGATQSASTLPFILLAFIIGMVFTVEAIWVKQSLS